MPPSFCWHWRHGPTTESWLTTSGGSIPRQAEAGQVYKLDAPAPKQLRQGPLQTGSLDIKNCQGGKGPSRQAGQRACRLQRCVSDLQGSM